MTLDYTTMQVINPIIGAYPLFKIFVLCIIFAAIFLTVSAAAVLKGIGLAIGIFLPPVLLFCRDSFDISKTLKNSETQEGNNDNTTK